MGQFKKYEGKLGSVEFLRTLNSVEGWEYCLNCTIHNGECADLAREGRCRAYHFACEEMDKKLSQTV